MNYGIVDFHTHPFLDGDENICIHSKWCNMSAERTKTELASLGIKTICGSVLSAKRKDNTSWSDIEKLNRDALLLAEAYGGFYIPGIHVHPGFPEESLREIKKARDKGVRLIGELVPYYHGWSGKELASKSFSLILRSAAENGMAVSIHTSDDDAMDEMVKNNPDTVIVAAHPGEKDSFERHLARMKMSRNYYLDISGTGIFRYGLLRHGIDEAGAERFLFGSDYPICSPAAYIGAVAFDGQLTEAEKLLILSKNAKRLLGI